MEIPNFAFKKWATPYSDKISMFMQGRMQSFESSQSFHNFLRPLSHLPAIHKHPLLIASSNVAPQRHLSGYWWEHLCIVNEQTSFHTRCCTLIWSHFLPSIHSIISCFELLPSLTLYAGLQSLDIKIHGYTYIYLPQPEQPQGYWFNGSCSEDKVVYKYGCNWAYQWEATTHYPQVSL